VFRRAGQAVEFGLGFAVVDVVPAEYLEHNFVQTVRQVGDLRGRPILDHRPGFDIGGQPLDDRLDGRAS